ELALDAESVCIVELIYKYKNVIAILQSHLIEAIEPMLSNLKEAFNFSLCSRCNNGLLKLASTKKKSPSNSAKKMNKKSSKKIKLEPEICDLTIAEDESFYDSADYHDSDEISEEDIYNIEDIYAEKDYEYEIHYGVFIKLDGKFLPTKWYKATISEIDEFLLEIHTNVIALTKNEMIEASDYNVTFKGEKAMGAGTQLVDEQDFQKFCSEYHRLSARKVNMEVFITINSQNLAKSKHKKDTDSEPEFDISDDNILETYKNKNDIPKVSNLTTEEIRIAENVTKIRTTNHCDLHNRACLNQNQGKENHVEITFMMLSTWASEINKGLATPMDPPTHPLFAYRLSKTKSSNSQLSEPNIPTSSYMPSPFYNPLHMHSNFILPYSISEQTTFTTRSFIPSIDDFLKLVDEKEDTGDYYQGFLAKFKQQRISVRILSRISDEEFKNCDVDTIGARQTLHYYAMKYNV
ncbi:27569_t:CDS:2, partial [Dentiscutata erythropus]